MKGKTNRKEQVYAQRRTEDIDWGCMEQPDEPISGKQQRLMMRTEFSHEVKTVDEYGNETGQIRRIHPAKGMKPKLSIKNKGSRHPLKWQKKKKKSEKQMVRTSLERYNVKYYTLRGDQLPDDSMCFVSIGQRKVSKLSGYKVLLDTGSTISTVTPVQAKRLVEELGWEIKKGQKFTVKNGGEVDEIFDGSYIGMPVQRPNSSKFIAIRFYVSPHNDIPHPLILGNKDMRCLGYGIHLDVGDGVIIFENHPQSKIDAEDAMAKKTDIITQMENAADIFGKDNLDYALKQKQSAFFKKIPCEAQLVATASPAVMDNAEEKADELKNNDDDEAEDETEDGSRPCHEWSAPRGDSIGSIFIE